jgi:hypothetical protein
MRCGLIVLYLWVIGVKMAAISGRLTPHWGRSGQTIGTNLGRGVEAQASKVNLYDAMMI